MHDYGLQQPISIRVDGDRFKLTSGMRRFAAAQMLAWPSIVAFVRTFSADEAYLVDLVENLQREDLSAEEEADALGELVRTRGWTLQQVADAAVFLRMHPEEVRRRAKSAVIPGAKAGRAWVFLEEDLVHYQRSLYPQKRQALQVTLGKELECHFASVGASGGSTSSPQMGSEYAALLGLPIRP